LTARRLRIAYVVDTYDDASNGGSISARRFVEALRQRHEVVVVAAGAPGPGRVALPRFQPPPFRRIMREMGFAFAVPRRRLLEPAIRGADVVHVQFPFWLGFSAARLARRTGTPWVAAFHVQPENMFRNVGLRSPALTEWTYRFFLRAFYGRADAVVCPSRFALEELSRRGLRVPAEVISNGIAAGFRPERMERFERHRDRVLLLSVGRLAREKRHDVIVEAVRRSRHARRIQLVITGRGPEERRVRRLAATLPLPGEVAFVSEPDLRRLLASADLLVHASEIELEGMAVLEAVGCGLPALIADAPHSASAQFAASPELLFRAGDPADLARRLDDLLDHPERLQAARRRTLALAAGYGLEESVRRLEAVYLGLAARRAGPPEAGAWPGPSPGAGAEGPGAPASPSTGPPAAP